MVLLVRSAITIVAQGFVTIQRISANHCVVALRIVVPDSRVTQRLLINAVRLSLKSAVVDKAQVKGASVQLAKSTPSACHRVVWIIAALIPVAPMLTALGYVVNLIMWVRSSHLCW